MGEPLTPDAPPDRLVVLCRRWGADPWRVQGPGGNLSFKDGDRMWVKPSGALLKDATASALVEVSVAACLRGIPEAGPGLPSTDQESAYLRAVAESSCLPDGPGPSMETGLHAVLPYPWVAHLHSLCGVILGWLDPDGPDALAALAPVRDAGFDVFRVAPAVPGLHLSWAMAAGAARAADRQGALWLLGNHGVVWAADDPDVLAEVEARFETGLRERFGADHLPPPAGTPASGLDFAAWPTFAYESSPLFPDYAVFFPRPEDRPSADGRTVRFPPSPAPVRAPLATELAWAQAVLSTVGDGLGVLQPLHDHFAAATAGLEIERLRRTAMG